MRKEEGKMGRETERGRGGREGVRILTATITSPLFATLIE